MANRFQERDRFRERRDTGDQITLASGVNFLAGIWLLLSPWVFGAAEGALWNAVIVGIVIAGLAATRLYGRGSTAGPPCPVRAGSTRSSARG